MTESSRDAPTAAGEEQASNPANATTMPATLPVTMPATLPATMPATLPDLPDVVAKFRDPIVELMVRYADTVLDCVAERKRLNVDDVRHELLGPTKEYLAKQKNTV